MHYKGFDIVESSRHGKAIAGTKATSSIQIREPAGKEGYYLKKPISFPVNDLGKRIEPLKKQRR